MSTRMDDLRDQAEDLHDLLSRTLGRIESEVGRLLEGAPETTFDRDRLLDALDEQAEDLCRALEAVNRYCDEAEEQEPANLNAIADATLSRQLDGISFPIVVQTAWSDEPPLLEIARDSLRSLLDQVVRLSLRFAGTGGAVQFGTRISGDQAWFSVEATTGEGLEVDAEEFSLRFESVADFVEGFGGGAGFDFDVPGRLGLELSLPIGIEIS